jgi:uncharacterized protein (UPF0147 family)
MFVDGDPKDPTETEDIELDEEQEETAEPTGDEEPAGDENDEEAEAGPEDEEQQPETQDDEDDDLPTDPKALRHIVREQQKMLERSQREPAARPSNATDEEPDPLMQSVATVIKDKSIPVDLRRVIYGLTQKLAQTEQEAMSAKRAVSKVNERDTERDIPQAHREGAKAISREFGIPLPVAHQLYKAQLYDEAVARKRAKKSGRAAPAAEAPAPSRSVGTAKHTFTRPVRGGGDGTAGAKTVDIAGVKVPLKFKSSSEYATFMDGLPSDKHRAIVLKARRNGTAAQIAG